MEEETLNESFPFLKELENKIGRKTPQSLLIWMRDAAECEEGLRPDGERDLGSALNSSFSGKISILKQEMNWLRSADVRILRQLAAVHEGIEAMRWLMEERDALVSRSSSLTGSLSSLVTLEGHGPPMSPCRESLSHNQGLTESTGEGTEDLRPHTGSNCHMLGPNTTESSPPHPLTSNCGSPDSACGWHSEASQRPNSLVSSPKSQPGGSALTSSQGIGANANTIRRALLRSMRARREVKVDTVFSPTKQSDETQREQQSQEDSKSSITAGTEESDMILLGYDAQWCWVESQDDVTFL